ncbi:hypothetical protein J3459_008203 [Metarhizium acridum]|nr:hypothetical protein J3459_008203 [Metarhizium acridum]
MQFKTSSSTESKDITTRQLNDFQAHRPRNRTSQHIGIHCKDQKARCSGPTSKMPVPFETLLPYAIMIGMFGVTGTGLAVVKTWRNEGKRPRYSLDQWDRQS